jgi:hypothetical protein
MDIAFSPRETGACPICKKNGNCTIQNSITNSFKNSDNGDPQTLEMVIYVCPYFLEIS